MLSYWVKLPPTRRILPQISHPSQVWLCLARPPLVGCAMHTFAIASQFSHNSCAGQHFGANWLCFAFRVSSASHLTHQTSVQLALFRTAGPPRNWVCFAHDPLDLANWLCSSQPLCRSSIRNLRVPAASLGLAIPRRPPHGIPRCSSYGIITISACQLKCEVGHGFFSHITSCPQELTEPPQESCATENHRSERKMKPPMTMDERRLRFRHSCGSRNPALLESRT